MTISGNKESGRIAVHNHPGESFYFIPLICSCTLIKECSECSPKHKSVSMDYSEWLTCRRSTMVNGRPWIVFVDFFIWIRLNLEPRCRKF
ncbi:MAG: hypothetical protein CL912_21255 [Deltaproteobacteria bacterium]|nr:hypothetical protein [Deltaproteobacteria bacterium]